MKNNKLKLYYIVLTGILAIKVMSTIFQVGLTTHYGSKIAKLKLQKHNLTQEQLRLTAELAQKTSLTTIVQSQDVARFHEINDTIVIDSTTEMASR